MRPALHWSLAAVALGGWLVLDVSATAPPRQAQPPPQAPAQAPAPAQPAGQLPPDGQAPQPPKPVFRTGAELVRVDVAVLDRKGVPVSSLTAGDFALEEDGVPQEIRTFQFVANTGLPEKDDDVSLTIRSRSHAAAEAAKDNVRLFLIFWDEYHIGQLASANRSRAYLTQFVRTAFGPTDIVGFMDPLTPIDAIKFTRDRLELAESVRKLVGRSGVYIPTRSGIEDAHLQQGDVERLRSEVTVSAVQSATVHLGGIRDGRKTLIVISEGLRGIQRDSARMMSDLIRSANDNNTAIYAIDPRGLTQQRFPSLWESIATDTGGDYYRSNDLERSFRQVVVESSGYYLLGYSPTDRRLDGRFHKIKVRVRPSGLDVRARTGYWAPSVAEIERARVKAAESEIAPDILQAFAELPGSNARRTVDFWVGTALDGGRPIVRLSWLARSLASAAGVRPAQVTAVVTQGETRVFDGAVAATGASFPAPPGALKVTFTVEDGGKEIIDREVRTIEVPDPDRAALLVTSPALFRSQNAREFRGLDRGPNALPFPGREFERTDRLVIRFEVHGTAASTAAVSARIISRWGKDLAELPLLPRPGGVGPYELDLPLSSVARGDYLIAMIASAGSDRARVLVPIRIVR